MNIVGKPLRFIDFFAGIGGFRLGMEQAGHICVGHCEIDKYANASYVAMHNPKKEEWYSSDISTVDAMELPEAEVYTFGFPCQAFSIAGKRRGFEDTRGTLIFEVLRLVEKRKPDLLFAENVRGLLSHDGGKTFETIITAMDELGYDVEWQVLNSKHFGVPQNRERIFILGHLRGGGCRRKVFPLVRVSEEVDELSDQNTDKVTNTIKATYDRLGSGSYVAERERETLLLKVNRLC